MTGTKRCYVNNPKSGAVMPPELNRENTLFYPEARMTTTERHTSSRPKDFHVMTDCPEFIGLYDRSEVFLWDKIGKEWINPDTQTYGLDLGIIRHELFGIASAIPAAVISAEGVTNCMGHPVSRRAKRKVKK